MLSGAANILNDHSLGADGDALLYQGAKATAELQTLFAMASIRDLGSNEGEASERVSRK